MTDGAGVNVTVFDQGTDYFTPSTMGAEAVSRRRWKQLGTAFAPLQALRMETRT